MNTDINHEALKNLALAICLCVLGIWFLSTDECKVTDDLSISTDEMRGTEPPSFEDLLDAIEFVESGGNASAIGDNGNAVGSFQIWKIYVDDVNRIRGNDKYSYTDRLDRSKSRDMATIYLNHYGGTFEEMARKFNGGPNGHKKEATLKYWVKVKERLEQ